MQYLEPFAPIHRQIRASYCALRFAAGVSHKAPVHYHPCSCVNVAPAAYIAFSDVFVATTGAFLAVCLRVECRSMSSQRMHYRFVLAYLQIQKSRGNVLDRGVLTYLIIRNKSHSSSSHKQNFVPFRTHSACPRCLLLSLLRSSHLPLHRAR